MDQETQAEAIGGMLARDSIRQVLAAYARGVDRADAALLISCYHPDATEEHGSTFTGNAHEYIQVSVPRIRNMGVMQHLLGTSHIDLKGDIAYVETYIWTFARFDKEGREFDTFTGKSRTAARYSTGTEIRRPIRVGVSASSILPRRECAAEPRTAPTPLTSASKSSSGARRLH